MIRIGNKEVRIEKFPDGTPRIKLDVTEIYFVNSNTVIIDWYYDGMEELFYLGAIKKHIEEYLRMTKIYLFMPYIPNARMDRCKNKDEVFTLKYFCDFINTLNFDKIYVLDAHSYVSMALLNHCVNIYPYLHIDHFIRTFHFSNNLVLYFPDAGSCKRYIDLFPDKPYCYGEKQRDWKTGKITGLEIRKNGVDLTGKTILMIDDICSYGGTFKYSAEGEKQRDWKTGKITGLEIRKNGVDLTGKTILMIDDICSYGGTFKYSAEALKQCGCGDIYAFATHTEDSVLDKEKGTFIKLLENNTVERLFTTNSLFRGEHEKIDVMEVGYLS